MRNAIQCAPRTCSVCGARLEKPIHGRPLKGEQEAWYIPCRCHVYHVWCFHPQSNGCWKVRSDMPLFDTREIEVIA